MRLHDWACEPKVALQGDVPAAIETLREALALLPADAPDRGKYETLLREWEAQ